MVFQVKYLCKYLLWYKVVHYKFNAPYINMAAQMFGNVPQLDSGYKFEDWIEVLESWFIANDITADAKKKGIFLSGLGSKSYATLRALLQPNKPIDKTYQVCKDTLSEHFAPQPTEIVQRYKFYTCVQESRETIPQFVARLRQLSEGCKFKELNSMLRDRLVVGCKDKATQRKLLSESELTFDKALKVAMAMEIANRDVEQLHSSDNGSEDKEVHQLRTTQMKERSSSKWNSKLTEKEKPTGQWTDQKLRCWRCGSTRHVHQSCPFQKEQCYQCQEIGHTKSQCKAVKNYFAR